ncbi:5-hydroxytryptamine receptor 3C-like isoform X1 [Solea solea]|uniref:5-hydroxytryptamine receptor 3C-like isoform X1 n=1 Tax=Solea solea TaxID=90069 RepID=UPI00272CB0A6|nr:5-hydroxytryptamine receptor 3C-like isoform X1 [Solea solea]
MALSEWTSVFLGEAKGVLHGDTWNLEFDPSIRANTPEPGWKEYISNTSARHKKPKTDKHLMFNVMASKRLILISMMWFLMQAAPCSAFTVNCSEPNQPALLKALTPLFNLSSIRPVMNTSTSTNVNISFIIYGILGVDEKSQLLMTYLWLYHKWINEFISWDPIQCGSDNITLLKKNLWVPDIVIEQFMDDNEAPHVPYVYLYSNGLVWESRPARVVSSCNLDIYTFPFDIQNCTLTFNSYLHEKEDLDVSLETSVEHIMERSRHFMTTVGEWELLDIDAYKQRDNDYNEVRCHIRLRRRATLYVVNLLIPSIFLITIDLFSFLLPPQSVDRSSFKMTLILGYTVFLLIMNDLLPTTGHAVPLLNVFFSLCLALMVGSLLETIVITNLLCGSVKVSPVPHWIQVLVLQILGFLVFLPRKAKNSDMEQNVAVIKLDAVEGPPQEKGPVVEDRVVQELRSLATDVQALRLQVEQQQLDGSQSSEDWIQVGFIIDRLLFGIYILFISVSFITIIIIWHNSYSQ